MTRKTSILVSLAAATAAAMSAAPASAADDSLRSLAPKIQRAPEIESSLATDRTVRVIVSVAAGSSTAAMEQKLATAATRDAAKAEFRTAVDAVVMRHFGPAASVNGSGLVRMSTSPSFSVVLTQTQLRSLAQDSRVVKIVPDAVSKTQLDVSTATIGMPAAWTGGSTGSGRVVAVIDTGVQTNHPFLGTARVVAEGCFLINNTCPNSTNEMTGTGAGAPTSGIAHGTHVAGISLGKNTVSGGVPAAGVAKLAKLIAINVFENTGYTYDSSMIRALEYVEDLTIANPSWGIRAANMSIGGSLYPSYCDGNNPDFKAVIDRLRKLKVSTVIAAGNSSSSNAMTWPSCISSAVSVGATNRVGDTIAYYSDINALTSLLAPGGDVYNGGAVVSSVLSSLYEGYQGTSMAAPHVAGAIGALAAKFGTKSVSEIEDALRRTGVDVTDTRITNGATQRRIKVDAAALFLASPTAAGNDKFASAKLFNSVGKVSYTSTVGATRETGEPTNGSSAAGSVWYKLKLPVKQKVILTTQGSNFDTVLSVYTGSAVNALTLKTQNDNASATDYHSKVAFTADANVTYYIAIVAKSASSPGTVRITVDGLPTNDDFAAARAVTVSTSALTLATGTNVGATNESGEPSTAGLGSVWWKFVAPSSGVYKIDTHGSLATGGYQLDTVLGVYTGSAVNALTEKASNDQGDGQSTSALTFTAVSGTTYYIAVGSWAYTTDRGSIRLTFTPPGFVYQGAKVTAR